MSVHELSVNEAAAQMRAGRQTAASLTDAVLERIARHDPFIRSHITVTADGARAEARRLDAELAAGEDRGPLHGIAIGVKDSIPVAGLPCTSNSRLRQHWVPEHDAPAIARLRRAGAIVVGKHTMNELGWSLPTEDDLAPPPRNPWFPTELAMGSSSGSGSAVASGFCYAAIGTDGGGSTRLPASQQNLFGLKPTHDGIPRVLEGSLSEIGLLTRTAADAAALFAAATADPGTTAALRERINAQVELVSRPASAVRLGTLEAYVTSSPVEPDVLAVYRAALEAASALGFMAADRGAAIPNLADGVPATFVVLCAEHHDRNRQALMTTPELFGPSSRLYSFQGAFVRAADYLAAQRVGRMIQDQVDRALGPVDFLILPTSPVTRSSTARNPETHRKGGNAMFTSPFNITGHPALSIPAGISAEGIPIGVQLVGPMGSELALLQAGRMLAEALARSWRFPAMPDLGALS